MSYTKIIKVHYCVRTVKFANDFFFVSPFERMVYTYNHKIRLTSLLSKYLHIFIVSCVVLFILNTKLICFNLQVIAVITKTQAASSTAGDANSLRHFHDENINRTSDFLQ